MRVWAFSAGGIDASARLMTGRGAFVGGYAVSLTCLLVDVTIVNAHDATLLGRLPAFPATFAG